SCALRHRRLFVRGDRGHHGRKARYRAQSYPPGPCPVARGPRAPREAGARTVSHLGELLSALVDGELNGAELDRANAHVAACGACRVEANALRRLKHELRSLAEVSEADDVTKRLLALASQPDQDGPVLVRYLDRERGRRNQPPKAGRRGLAGPFSARRRLIGRRRGRYVLWSTVSLV